jgi:hypothetical protein
MWWESTSLQVESGRRDVQHGVQQFVLGSMIRKLLMNYKLINYYIIERHVSDKKTAL